MNPCLILFVDAFAFDYLAKRPLLPGFWQEMLPVNTLLGYSSSLVPVLWSGKYPDKLDLWNEFYYQPRRPYPLLHWIDALPGRLLRNFLRLLVSRYGRRYVPNSTPALPACVEANFSRHPIHYHEMPPAPLGESGIHMRLQKAGLPFHFWYPYQRFQANRMLHDLSSAMGKARIFIYGTAALDTAGHLHGPHPEKFETIFKEIEAFLLGAHQILSQFGAPRIILISDHGMTEVIDTFDLLSWLEPLKIGKDYLAFLDATMARFWRVNDQPLDGVVQRLQESTQGRFLEHSDLSRYGLNFPNQRFGEIIYVLKPGCVLKPSFMDSPEFPFLYHPTQGMHGYEPASHPSTRAVFLYHGIKKLSVKPNHLTDIANILEKMIITAP